MAYTTRPARREDAATIARIYNEGIEDRLATFETRRRSEQDVAAWLDPPAPHDWCQVLHFGTDA